MNHESIDGLVMRVTETGENDAYLSVLTKEKGRFGLLSKGARSIKGGKLAISQIFTYANFEYYTRGEVNILKGGSVNKSFFEISRDFEISALGFYLCELACEVSDENVESGELLRLLLNALYALIERLYPKEIIKAAFELRAMALSGYTPTLSACHVCGRTDAPAVYLNVEEGTLVCPDCLSKTRFVRQSDYDDVRRSSTLLPLSPATLEAMRYCVGGPLSRIFSFALEDEGDLASLCSLAERYVTAHLERGFVTLNSYRTAEAEAERMAALVKEAMAAKAAKTLKKGDKPES